MDKDGEPLDMSSFGPVYIKYNSLPPPAGATTDPPGTARLSGYNGDFRGVYVNANLADGVFRQYAVLPLDLFTAGIEQPLQFSANEEGRARLAAEEERRAAAESEQAQAVSDASAGSNTREGRSVGQQSKISAGALNAANVRALLLDLPEFSQLAELGVAVSVREVSSESGRVVLSYEGPANLRRAVELNLKNALKRADEQVRTVDFE